MARPKKDLSAKQRMALTLLVAGHSQEAVASEAGIHAKTIQGWMREPFFRDELRLALERTRQIFESRVMGLANNAAVVLGEMITDSKNKERQLEGVKVAFNAAVRLSTRYKELQVEGIVAPAQPLVVFPAGTQFPWQGQLALSPGPIDVEATIIDDEPTGDEEES